MDDVLQILVGPMPPDLFLTEFFPSQHSEDNMTPPHHAFDKVPVDAEESHLYQSVADALSMTSEGGVQRCPGITFFYTRDKEKQPENENEQFENDDIAKPNPNFDIVGYANQDPIFQDLLNMRSNAKVPFLPQRAELVITLRTHDIAKDPASPEDTLKFPPRRGPNGQDLTRLALEELLSTANEINSHQLRTFLFTLLVTRKEARFFRWDHAGVVMSAAFDYHKSPEILCKFLWQFGKASQAGRGRDTSVDCASTDEEAIFKDAVERHVESQLGDDIDEKVINDEVNRHHEAGHVIKLPVQHKAQNGFEKRSFLVSRPVAFPISMASRATRGYWAMDLGTKEIVFLKDTWRTNAENMEVEGDILLSMKGVPNVPTLVCHGDVGDANSLDHAYITQTDRYQTAEWNAHRPAIQRLTSQVHYRQVIKEAGYTLESLAGSEELFRAIADVYNALESAYELHSRMHRDVSFGNIIFFANQSDRKYGQRQGILIDWERSCVTEKPKARNHWITGTWAFMSINTLSDVPKPHALVHDVGSLVYVVFYCAISYLQWDYNVDTHADILQNFFDHFEQISKEDDSKIVVGGSYNPSNLFNTGRYFKKPKGLPLVIQKWLSRSVQRIYSWYFSTPPDRTPEAQKECARPLFDLTDNIFKDLSNTDKEVHPMPNYKGPLLMAVPATPSSTPPSSNSQGS